MYGSPEKRANVDYGFAYGGDLGDVWDKYFSQFDPGDEKAWLKLVSLLISFFSSLLGELFLSQVRLFLCSFHSILCF